MLQTVGILNHVADQTELYKEVIKIGYLHPKSYIDAMFDYYNKFGRQIIYPQCALRDWMRHEKKNPHLTEEGCIYLSSFLELIPQHAVCRICDLLQWFELTPTQAIFTIKGDKERVTALDNWVAEHIDMEKIQAYNRQIIYICVP